jgi:hypothetical protein
MTRYKKLTTNLLSCALGALIAAAALASESIQLLHRSGRRLRQGRYDLHRRRGAFSGSAEPETCTSGLLELPATHN